MRINARLFATLREGRGKEVSFDVPEGTTAENIINQLGISKEEVAILLINGRDGAFDKSLSPEDTLSIFPPVGGG